jgi:hypothetical protein
MKGVSGSFKQQPSQAARESPWTARKTLPEILQMKPKGDFSENNCVYVNGMKFSVSTKADEVDKCVVLLTSVLEPIQGVCVASDNDGICELSFGNITQVQIDRGVEVLLREGPLPEANITSLEERCLKGLMYKVTDETSLS